MLQRDALSLVGGVSRCSRFRSLVEGHELFDSVEGRVLRRDALSLVGEVSRSSRFRSLVDSLDFVDVVE